MYPALGICSTEPCFLWNLLQSEILSFFSSCCNWTYDDRFFHVLPRFVYVLASDMQYLALSICRNLLSIFSRMWFWMLEFDLERAWQVCLKMKYKEPKHMIVTYTAWIECIKGSLCDICINHIFHCRHEKTIIASQVKLDQVNAALHRVGGQNSVRRPFTAN